MAVKLKQDENGRWWQAVEVWEPVANVTEMDRFFCESFRAGQKDRTRGTRNVPLEYNYGAYIKGWHAPDQKMPPYVTEAQSVAFNL